MTRGHPSDTTAPRDTARGHPRDTGFWAPKAITTRGTRHSLIESISAYKKNNNGRALSLDRYINSRKRKLFEKFETVVVGSCQKKKFRAKRRRLTMGGEKQLSKNFCTFFHVFGDPIFHKTESIVEEPWARRTQP